MTDAGDPGHGSVPPPPTPPVPPGGWQAPTPAPPSAPPPAPPHHGAPPPTAPAYPAAPPVGYGQPQAYAQPAGYGYGYPSAPKNDGMAIAALVCGIVAIPMYCGIGLVLGVLGVVFGIISMRKIDRSGGTLTGRGMALAGAICGGVGLAINLIFWVWVIAAGIAGSSN